MRQPSTALALVRVVVIAVLTTLLSFVVSLFLSVIGIMLVNVSRGGGIDVTIAYRRIAFPIAIAAFVIAFGVVLVLELRHLRRARGGASNRRAA